MPRTPRIRSPGTTASSAIYSRLLGPVGVLGMNGFRPGLLVAARAHHATVAEATEVLARVEAERADEVPAVFTAINIKFIVTGSKLKEKQVQRAVELSAEKYCSASIMLGAAGVEMTHSYEIVEFAAA